MQEFIAHSSNYAVADVERTIRKNNHRPMRVSFFIGKMSAGGAERVTAVMANYWAAKGWSVTLLTSDNGSKPSFYELDPRIDYMPLGFPPNPSEKLTITIRNTPAYFRMLRAGLRKSKPDVVISFMPRNYVIAFLASCGLNIPLIISNRTDTKSEPISKVWTLLRRWTYSQASRIVELTDEARHHLPQTVQQKARVIPNPVVISGVPVERGRVSREPRNHCIIAMGRLVHQKGFDLLLRAFAKIAPNHPDWELEIWGEGSERASLEALCQELALNERVKMPGLAKQPYEQFRQADLFVLSSRYEGFPNVLIEAMACGLPVVSFDCPSGPSTIIRDGIDGVLVPSGNVDALAHAISRLMNDVGERKRLALRALEVLERFGIERVMGMWEQLIEELVPVDNHSKPR